jgi:hypothetical protein
MGKHDKRTRTILAAIFVELTGITWSIADKLSEKLD